MSQVDSKDSIVKIEQDSGSDLKNGANEFGKSAFFVKTEIKTEPESSENRDSDNFFKSLRQFHDNKGTPYYKLPKIGGRDIDLHRLYTVVTSRGGWLKVNNRNEWDKVLHECGFPAKCVNANVAVKQIYIRYLDRYEKINFHKEDSDDRNDNEEEEEGTRHKRWSARSLNSVPMVYNYAQHNVAESARVQHKLSTALLKTSEYDKLLMSLLSPLPNEQDFAINVCTLMANESKPTLKVEKCPKLVDALLAHAGIYNHYTTREIFIEFYQKTRKHSLQSFWNDSLIDKPDILELSYEDYFASNDNLTQKKHEIISKIKEFHLCIDDTQDPSSPDDKIISNLDFLCLGRGLGTHDYIGQRVHQIASILRNLSFIDDNLVILAKNKTYLRFLIICSNIHWGNLQHMGLDMLGNIASELELNDIEVEEMPTYLLKTVSEGLDSSDRAVIISCLEILLKLCQKESNEDYLQRYLSKKIYSQVCMYLCLSDIMLLLYTLECIYALSSLGEKACNAICHVRGTIDTLVSLVTVEAQSYGPDACILMRVVETVPGNTVTSQNQLNFNSSTAAESKTTLSQMTSVDNNTNILSPIKTTTTNSGSSTRMTTTITPSQSSPVPNTKQENQILSKANDRLLQQQTFQENEQFALAWLRATFEPAQTTSNRIEQQDLYKLYMSASSQIGRRGFVSPAHFPKCVRMVFGPTIGPVQMKMETNGKETMNMFYEGIKIRAKPFPVVHKGSVVTGQVTTQNMENTNAPTPMDTTPPTTQKVVNTAAPSPVPQPVQPQITIQPTVIQQTQPVQQPAQQHQTPILHKVLITSNSSPATVASQIEESNKLQAGGVQQPTQSSLIKSLLANKVTSEGSNQPVATPNSISTTTCLIAPNANLHQVAQRQQLKQQQQQQQQQQLPITMNVALQNNLKSGGLVCQAKLPPPLTNATISKVSDLKMEKTSWDPVPPLAPLSGINTIRHTQISLPSKIDEDSNSNSISSSVLQNDSESSRTSAADMTESDEDMMSIKDSLNKQSHVVSANKMLADLLEKKSMEPPPCFNAIQIENPLKRKMDGDKEMDSCPTEEKRITIKMEESDEHIFRPSSKAADLYAELAASMLEDEDLEEENPTPNTIKLVTNQIKSVPQSTTITLPPSTRLELKKPGTMIQQQIPVTSHIVHNVVQQQAIQTQSNMLHQTTNAQGQQVITVPLQRQIIMSPNNQGQVMLSSQGPHQLSGQMTQTTATIKTESGYQTVPVLLQHSAPTNTIQIQKQMGGQQIIQPMMHQPQNQTQYILTTNQQGQTVVVAQQAPQPQLHQTVLVTQTPQQQGTSAKTIIILQQPQNNSQSQMQQGTIMGTMQPQQNTPQKMYMTTQQGQQVVVTQVPRPLQHHVIMNHGNQQQLVTSSSMMGQNTQQIVIQNQPQLSVASQQFVNTITQSPQIILQHQSQQLQHQPQHLQQQQQQLQLQQMQEKTELIKIGNQIVQVKTDQSNQQQQQLMNNQQLTIQKLVNSQNIQTHQSEIIQTNVNTMQHQATTIQHTAQQQQSTQHATQQQQPTQHATQQQQPIQHATQQPIAPQPIINIVQSSAALQPVAQPKVVQQPVAPTPQPQPPPPPPKPVEVIPKMVPPPLPPKIIEDTFDNKWLYVCDWRGCPKRKYKSLMDVYMHACNVHCPDNIDPTADIYCQWGPGPSLCDNLPRKRFSLMTHIFDRHCTMDSFKVAMQRRVSAGNQSQSSSAQMQPVTIIKQPSPPSSQPPSEPPTTTANGTITSTAAMHAIKRHALDYVASKELLDENEGPVTKSIRLTAALILRNLVNYTSSAKRSLRYYEPHLAGVALSNVESSRTIAQVLFEMNETHPI